MNFADLQLIPPLLQAVQAEGYTEPTPIQRQAIPHVLEGRDLVGCAQTGTGKTAAFVLPILQRLQQQRRSRPGIRVLVLAPTRELASQIGEGIAAYGRHLAVEHTVIFGGVGQQSQERALRRPLDIVVATPGRLLDLMGQGLVRWDALEVLVLDEADRMLDMGFIHDVRKVIQALPTARQTLLFSATMPGDIQKLVASILKNPARVSVVPPATTAERIEQRVIFVTGPEKKQLLVDLLADPAIRRVLVFTRTKHGANRVAEVLNRAGIAADAIHGNKSQGARERALAAFKAGESRALVATDIAARGIDIDDVTHVINFELPNVPESYVHRIGRTARAGAAGIAYSLCDRPEYPFLLDIERLIGLQIPEAPRPPKSEHVALTSEAPLSRSGGPRGGGRGGGPSGGRNGVRGGGRGGAPAGVNAGVRAGAPGEGPSRRRRRRR